MKTVKCNICKRETENAYYTMRLNIAGKGKGEYDGSYNVCILCIHKIFDMQGRK